MSECKEQVTISAAFFAELWMKAKEADDICKSCREEHTAEEFNALVKERDELKHQLETEKERCKECAALCAELTKERDELKAKLDAAEVDRETYKDRAETAERCVEDIAKIVFPNERYIEASYGPLGDIIRAYREAKEAK